MTALTMTASVYTPKYKSELVTFLSAYYKRPVSHYRHMRMDKLYAIYYQTRRRML